MTTKNEHPVEEVQLGFSFFTEATEASEASALTQPQERPGKMASEPRSRSPKRPGQRKTKPQDFVQAIAIARTALLETPLAEVDAHLPVLLEFCEAALTRALDVVPTRSGAPFSQEEYRSLRGIGQAQWLLVEQPSGDDLPAAMRRTRKTKPVKRDE